MQQDDVLLPYDTEHGIKSSTIIKENVRQHCKNQTFSNEEVKIMYVRVLKELSKEFSEPLMLKKNTILYIT